MTKKQGVYTPCQWVGKGVNVERCYKSQESRLYFQQVVNVYEAFS